MPTVAFAHLDHGSATVVVVPSLVGINGASRVIFSRNGEASPFLAKEILPGQSAVQHVQGFGPLHHVTAGLECRREGAWAEAASAVSLTRNAALEVLTVRPSDWGVDEACIVVVSQDGQILHRAVVPQGEVTEFIADCSIDRKFDVTLSRPKSQTFPKGGRLYPGQIRLVPPSQRRSARFAAAQRSVPGNLGRTLRSDVVLEPVELHSPGSRQIGTKGFVGAWENGQPIPEATDFTLGRQEFLFRREPSARPKVVAGRHIYMGRPRSGFGHFLTQGLARAWFALEEPGSPILWDSTGLRPYQLAILEMLGIQNQNVFLRRATCFEEVVFPYPGIGLGDYVEKSFAELIGRVKPQSVVVGKKSFLTRSSLAPPARGGTGEVGKRLDDVFRAHGFDVHSPERLPIREQLEVLSSSEVVVGLEGSALHLPILLRGLSGTRYVALSRHRRGTGIFEHIKAAKNLDYQTLNYLLHGGGSSKREVTLDFSGLDRDLRRTSGFMTNMDAVVSRVETPSIAQGSFETLLGNVQLWTSKREEALADAVRAVRRGDTKLPQGLLGGLY